MTPYDDYDDDGRDDHNVLKKALKEFQPLRTAHLCYPANDAGLIKCTSSTPRPHPQPLSPLHFRSLFWYVNPIYKHSEMNGILRDREISYSIVKRCSTGTTEKSEGKEAGKEEWERERVRGRQ